MDAAKLLAIVLLSSTLISGVLSTVSIKWDVLGWTTDGYLAKVTIDGIPRKGFCSLYGWTWTRKEVIWELDGALVVDQGNCTRFIGNKPLSCDRSLQLLVAHNATFVVTVGDTGLSKDTIFPPTLFTLMPGDFTCGTVESTTPSSPSGIIAWKSYCNVSASNAYP